MNEELKRNIDVEISMLREISYYYNKIEGVNNQERKLILGAIQALQRGIKIINSSIPGLLAEISPTKKLPNGKKNLVKRGNLETVNVTRKNKDIDVTLEKKDKDRFLRELTISDKFISRLKKTSGNFEDEEIYQEFTGSRGYLKLANKLFLHYASKSVRKGRFKNLSISIKKANIDILFESYVAMMYFTTFLSIFAGFFIAIFLTFFDINTTMPYLVRYDDGYLLRFVRLLLVPIFLPVLVFLAIYFYPSTERKSVALKIDQELPFAVIHMSAISGSGIAPSEIFKIIGLSREYPYLRKEIRKVLNQINLYGYDLITALNRSAKSSPSEKLSDLLSGLSSTITSGANLQDFFDKRAETLLLGYRLEREKYNKLIETFLDIYISVVVAAPMVFLLLLILMSISGLTVGFTSVQLSIISVVGIALLNLIFLFFLQVKQPPY